MLLIAGRKAGMSSTSFRGWHNSLQNAWGRPECTSESNDGCHSNRAVAFISVENTWSTWCTFSKLNVLLRSHSPRFFILNCYDSLLNSTPYYKGQRALAPISNVTVLSIFSSSERLEGNTEAFLWLGRMWTIKVIRYKMFPVRRRKDFLLNQYIWMCLIVSPARVT